MVLYRCFDALARNVTLNREVTIDTEAKLSDDSKETSPFSESKQKSDSVPIDTAENKLKSDATAAKVSDDPSTIAS